MKTCRKCSQELPNMAFTRNKAFADGLSPWCAKCRSTYRKEQYASLHPERKRVTSESDMAYKFKLCIDCVQELPVSHFHRKRSAADGKNSYCKECGNARSIKWHRDNKDKAASWRLEWRQKSPRQSLSVTLHGALKRRPTDNPATLDDLLRMFESQNGRCALSGIKMTWAQGKVLPTSITIDRLDPAKDYSADNIRLICHAFNSFRGRMTDDEMFAMALALIGNMKPKLRLVA